MSKQEQLVYEDLTLSLDSERVELSERQLAMYVREVWKKKERKKIGAQGALLLPQIRFQCRYLGFSPLLELNLNLEPLVSLIHHAECQMCLF